VSIPESELVAEATELRPLGGDEAFFAAHVFQTPRFRVVVPECRVSGLAYAELLQGKSYRAGSVHFSRPSFEALVNRDKPPKPFVKSPLMVHEALAFIRRNLGVLKQARGDRQGAAELYQAVLDQLRNADPEFATLLAEVKRRLSEVTRES
jgi:hypothetical protein